MTIDWTAVGVIAEVVSALGVILSLIYVAHQIRQNSRMIQGATIQAVTDSVQRELEWSGNLAAEWVRAIESPDRLSKAEYFRLGEWMIAALRCRQNEYHQYRRDLLDADMWEASRDVIRTIMSVQWSRDWWRHFDKGNFDPAFLEVVENAIREAEQAGSPYLGSIHADRTQGEGE